MDKKGARIRVPFLFFSRYLRNCMVYYMMNQAFSGGHYERLQIH